MNWIIDLFFGDGIAHSILIIALVITAGIALGKVKIAGISLGVTWILFVGIIASHFGMLIDSHVLHFVKEFGLILFVYSIGLQVGPGFFSSFKKGGLQLNMLAAGFVLLGVAIAYIIHRVTGTNITTMVGILSGAVTNTPGLGAAQQAYTDVSGMEDPTIAMGYAVAYPLGVIGIIVSLIAIRYVFRIKFEKEDEILKSSEQSLSKTAQRMSAVVKNQFLSGKTVKEVKRLINRPFMISRVLGPDGHVVIAGADTILTENDKVRIIANTKDIGFVINFIGEKIEMEDAEWETDSQLVSRRIMITKSGLNGKHLGELKFNRSFGVNITRVNRAGVDLIPNNDLQLQLGDRLTVVGSENAIKIVEKVIGNSLQRLREPNLIPIFLGVFLGVVLGSIPFTFPGIPQPVKLGLAGGPLIVAILIGRFGPRYRLVTYTTMSANLMLREIGIALFLAAVGLGAGEGFVETVVYEGGHRWIGYGAIITILPILIIGIIARAGLKMNYYTLMGLVAGSSTDPPALAYSNATAGNDLPAVSYSTVYPLTMFLRVLTAQMLILIAV